MASSVRQRVLVIEDEALIAMLLEDILLEMDDYVVDVFAHFDQGLQAARTGEYAFAILDVNLNGVYSYPIADVLSERDISFVFSTGYGSITLDEAYAKRPVLHKPYQPAQLRRIVAQLLHTHDGVDPEGAQDP